MPIPHIGELAAIGAAVVWSFSIVAFKFYGDGIGAARLNLMKNSIAALLLIITTLAISAKWPRESEVWFWLAFSGAVSLGFGDNAGFFCMKALGAQASAALQLLIPPFTIMLALFAIRESLTMTQQIGMLITVFSIAGALYFRSSFPKWQALDRKLMLKGIAAGVFSAGCQAVGIVSARHVLVGNVDPWSATTIRIGASVIVLILLAAFSKRRKHIIDMAGEIEQPLTPKKFTGIVAASFIGSYMGLTLLSLSSVHAKAGVTASLCATVPIWIIPISYVFLRERASWRSVGCTVFALVGIVLIFV